MILFAWDTPLRFLEGIMLPCTTQTLMQAVRNDPMASQGQRKVWSSADRSKELETAAPPS